MTITPQDDNPYASPQSEEAAIIVSDPTPAWRDGELVVVTRSSEIPLICIVCGRQADGGFGYVRKYLQPTWLGKLLDATFMIGIFSFMACPLFFEKDLKPILDAGGLRSSWFFLVYIATLLVLVFVYVEVKKSYEDWSDKLRLFFKYCAKHGKSSRREKLWRGAATTVTVMLLYIGLRHPGWIGLLLGIVSFGCITIFVGRWKRPHDAIRVTSQSAQHVWLSGFGKPFLDSLPPYPHAAERSSPAIIP